MAKTVALHVITPTSLFFSGEVHLVIARGSSGDLGVLPGHAPLLTTLRPGILTLHLPQPQGEPEVRHFATSGGALRAMPNDVTVFVDDAFSVEHLDRHAVQVELDAAIERQRRCDEHDLDAQRRERDAVSLANAKMQLFTETA